MNDLRPDRQSARLIRFRRALGNELRVVRKRRGWTRRDLHRRLGGVVSLQALASYEQGVRTLPVTRFIEIAEALTSAPDDLFRRAYEQTSDTNATGCVVDLRAVAELTAPELLPLRRWAQSQLRTPYAGNHPIVRLDLTAVTLMAELCGVSTTYVITAALSCQPGRSGEAAAQ